ncbi:MAG: hypothetical protein ABI977_29635 [Acidobacteriota bacterium]
MKRFSIFTACLSALLFITLATAAFSQDPSATQGKRAGRHHRKLKKMDANRDGQITRDEWKGRPKAFGKLDKDNDGTISRQEAMNARQDRGKQRLKRIDTNNDGQISRNEWNGNPDAFSKLDANNDGIITKEEMKAGRHKAQRPPQ